MPESATKFAALSRSESQVLAIPRGEFECAPYTLQSVFARDKPKATFCVGSSTDLTFAGASCERTLLVRVLVGTRKTRLVKFEVRTAWVLYITVCATPTLDSVYVDFEFATKGLPAQLATTKLDKIDGCAQNPLDVQLSEKSGVGLGTFLAGMIGPTSQLTPRLVQVLEKEPLSLPRNRWTLVPLTNTRPVRIRKSGFFADYELAGHGGRALEFKVKVGPRSWSPAIGPVIVPSKSNGDWALWATLVTQDDRAYIVMSAWPDQSPSQVLLRTFSIAPKKKKVQLQIKARVLGGSAAELTSALQVAYFGPNDATRSLPECCVAQPRLLRVGLPSAVRVERSRMFSFLPPLELRPRQTERVANCIFPPNSQALNFLARGQTRTASQILFMGLRLDDDLIGISWPKESPSGTHDYEASASVRFERLELHVVCHISLVLFSTGFEGAATWAFTEVLSRNQVPTECVVDVVIGDTRPTNIPATLQSLLVLRY